MRTVTIRRVALAVSLATFVVITSLPAGLQGPVGDLIGIASLYAIFVLCIVARLPGGSANIAFPAFMLRLLRHLSRRFGVRVWLLGALVATVVLFLYAYFIRDLIPSGLILSILFAALLPLLIHASFDVVELIHPKKFAPQAESASKELSLLRRLAIPVTAISVLGLLAVCLSATSSSRDAGLMFIAIAIAVFSPVCMIYGIHLLYAFIQYRRASPFLWPPNKRSIWHKVGIWIPSLIATITLLFLPQVCAVSGHLWHGPAETLPHYRIRIPWDWWVCDRGVYGEEDQAIAVLIGKGIAQVGFRPYLTGGWLRSFVSFRNHDYETEEHRLKQKAQKGGKGVSSHDLRIGNVQVTCWEYSPQARWWEVRGYPPQWEVDCATPRDGRMPELYASFIGPKEDISNFYRVVEMVEQTD